MSYLVCAFGRVLGFLCGLFSKLLIGDFKVNLYLVTAADLYAINQTGQNHVFGFYVCSIKAGSPADVVFLVPCS